MSLQLPQYNYMDYGQIAQNVESIKGRKLQNEVAQHGLNEAKEQTENRKRAKAIRQQFDNTPAQIEEFERQGMFQEADQLRESYVSQSKAQIDYLESLRAGVNKDNYKPLRSKLLQAGAIDPDLMPVEYSDDWFRSEVDKYKEKFTTNIRKWEEQGVMFNEQIERDSKGNVTWRSGKYRADLKDKPKDGFTMKAADSNAISRYSSELYGGMWDPVTQRYSGLNKDQAKDVAAINERAAKIYSKNEGRIPHAEAVNRAARQMGINIRDLQGERDGTQDDPAGIRNYSTP